jgi:inhibitor of KinA
MIALQPLGDQAALASFSTELEALHFAAAVRQASPTWLLDVVQAYATVAVFFTLESIQFAAVATLLRHLSQLPQDLQPPPQLTVHHIPCCYEMNLDLTRIAELTGWTTEEVIRLHTGTTYTVYAIGFCPGFPYLGYLPTALEGVPRLSSPRLRVEAGSIGLTGRQTGIYTEARPGGWNIVGRTPLELVNVRDGYFPLRTGDCVRFDRIDERQFRSLQGNRLLAGQ